MVHADEGDEEEERKEQPRGLAQTQKRKLLGRGKKLKTSDMFDDYKAKPNSVAAMSPAASQVRIIPVVKFPKLPLTLRQTIRCMVIPSL